MNMFFLEMMSFAGSEQSLLPPPGLLQSSVENTPGARSYHRASITAAPVDQRQREGLLGFSERLGYFAAPDAFLLSFFQIIAKGARHREVLWALKQGLIVHRTCLNMQICSMYL